MTRDLPIDADEGNAGDHAGDAAYRVATGVARVARAGAYVTGGALIASGSGTPTTSESHADSRIAGWSVKDPQPNAPSPVVTYPDPSPDSVPPVLGHQGPAGPMPQNIPPGIYVHIQINPGPSAGEHVPGMPDLDKLPGMNGVPGTESAPGLSMVPGTDDGPGAGHPGDNLPGTGDVPGLGNGVPGFGNGVPGLGNGVPGFGNGVPGLGNGVPGFGNGVPGLGHSVPGLGNGIPGLGNNPGAGDSPFGLPGGKQGVPGLHVSGINSGNGIPGFGVPGLHPSAAPIAADGSPGATLPGAPSGFGPIDLGDQSGVYGQSFGQFGSDAGVPHAVPDSGMPGFHLPGVEAAGFDLPGSGFDGIGGGGVGGGGVGAFFDVSTQLNAHAGLDGAWVSVDTQVHASVGDLGQQLDNYGNWLGGGHQFADVPPGTNAALAPGVAAPGPQPGMAAPVTSNPGPAHIPGGAPAGHPAPGVVSAAPAGAAGTAPVSGIGLPGAAPTAVPAMPVALPTAAPAVPGPTPVPVVGVALPTAPAAPVFVAAPPVAAPVAVTQPVAPAPAPAVAPPAPPVPQPVITTPLQAAAHPDVVVHAFAGVLADHLGPIPLSVGAVGPAAFLGLPGLGPFGTPSGEHATTTGTASAQPLTGTVAHSAVPRVSVAPVPETGEPTPSHIPARTTFGPRIPGTSGPANPTGTHASSGEPTPTATAPSRTTTGVATSSNSAIAAHSSPADTADPTTAAHPSSTGAGDSTTAAHPTPTSAEHPSSTGTGHSTTAAHPSSTGAADSTSSMPSRGSVVPTHNSAPTQIAPTHDVPTHEPAPTQDYPMPSRAPSMPAMPSHEAPPAVTINPVPGAGGSIPSMHIAPPHVPLQPPTTLDQGAHLPMKPIAHVPDPYDFAPWNDSGHAGLTAASASPLSGDLLPGSDVDPAHILVHPVLDPHIAL